MTFPGDSANSQESRVSITSSPDLANNNPPSTKQFSQSITGEGEWTPPSSFSNLKDGSQNNFQVLSTLQDQSPNEHQANDGLKRLSNIDDQKDASRHSNSSSSPNVPESPTTPSKSLINGSLQPPSEALQIGERDGIVPKHTRNKSTETTGSNITDLSSQLKTRLSYAMIKVQNGWEDRSIDEIESLASQLSSPISTIDSSRTLQSINRSPRHVMSSVNSRSRDLSQVMAIDPDDEARSIAINLDASISNLTRIETKSHPATPSVAPGLTAGPALVPAPEFTSSVSPADRSHRRVNSHNAMPPTLMTTSLHSSHITPSETAEQSTPPQPRGRASTPTPQEQDAVSTLLFMSSPANSGYFPNRGSSAQPSPLRPEFTVPSRKGKENVNGLATTQRTKATKRRSLEKPQQSESGARRDRKPFVENEEPRAKRRSVTFLDLRTESDVDRLLDQMDDTTDEEEKTYRNNGNTNEITPTFGRQEHGIVRM